MYKRQVVVGGIIPDQDRINLLEMGVAEVFGPGTSSGEIVKFVRNNITNSGA